MSHPHPYRARVPQIIRIKSFSSNTVGDVQAAMDRFKSKGVNRLVVDLRGNVGGLLPAGIDTAGLFLDSGKVLYCSINIHTWLFECTAVACHIGIW